MAKTTKVSLLVELVLLTWCETVTRTITYGECARACGDETGGSDKGIHDAIECNKLVESAKREQSRRLASGSGRLM